MMATTPKQTNGSIPVLSQNWKYALIACGVTILSVIIAFWPTYAAIVEIWWRSETFTHGFIILPIVAYLVWQKRNVLLTLIPCPGPIALVFVFGTTLLWLLAHAADIAVAQHVAVVALIPGLIWVTMGTQVVRAITFPLAYLFFAAPFGDFLVEPLQDITATFSVWALQLTGIPVHWEGRFLQIPTGSFEVAQACSGIRYLIASLALGTLYAHMTYSSYWRRFAFIMLSLVVPIVANGIRAYGIIMLAHLSDYSLAVGVDHLIYGWIFFGLVMFFMIWLGSLFRDKDNIKLTSNFTPEAARTIVSPGLSQFVTWGMLTIALSVSTPVLANLLDAQQAKKTLEVVTLPSGRNGWDGPVIASEQWNPEFIGATESKGSYSKGHMRVEVYVAYYSRQTQGAELIGWNNASYNSDRSKRLGGGSDSFSLVEDRQNWQVLYNRVTSQNEKRLIWYWYEIDGKPTTNKFTAKLYEMQRRLFSPENGSAALLMSTTYELTHLEASKVLTVYLNDMLPALRKAVNQ